jgi:drug/metabolite transporter (DMT)-like permease
VTAGVLAAVLFSAVLHGIWNAIAKALPDRLATSTLFGVAFVALGLPGALLLAAPPPAAWPYLLGSAALQTVYLLLLTQAYARVPFGTAYPMARGIGVVVVTLVSVALLGERLTAAQLAGVVAVVGGLAVLAMHRGGLGRSGWVLTVAVGITISGYTVLDGVGVRTAGTVPGYASWLFLVHGLMTVLTCGLLARDRAALRSQVRRHAPLGLLGGAMSVVAYGIVVWAQSQAPLAVVAALRETGVVISGVIGLVVFRERMTTARTAAALAAATGIVVIRIGS